MSRRSRKTKVTLFFTLLGLLISSIYVLFSNNFEREAPNIIINDTIYWNTRDKIELNIQDNIAIKKIFIEYARSDSQDKQILKNQNVNSKEAKISLELPKPKFNENIEKYTVWIKVVDNSLWNWFGGNESVKTVNVIVDNKKPEVSVLANSYNITKGGSASVVFYANDDNLTDLFIEVNSRVFKAVPFVKENYYIALIAWDLKDSDFEARIVAKDKANNTTKERIPYFYTNKKYRVSNISVSDNFIDGKIKDLYEVNSDNSISDKAKMFDYVNATLREENEKIIYKITRNISDELVSDFRLNAFLPLKNGKKVADFGDHRYYKYNDEQISESYHMGLDLASTRMAPIILSNKGKVVFAQDNGIYGLNLIIDHGLGLYTLYAHCTKKNVDLDDEPSSNSIIASTGTSGLALGDHLHFGVLVQGVEVRPEEWMDNKWMKDNIFDIINKAKEIIRK